MKTITLRNMPAKVASALERKCREADKSAARVVMDLLTEALGLGQPGGKRGEHRDLDHLAGRWSGKEAAKFEAELEAQRAVDEEVWR